MALTKALLHELFEYKDGKLFNKITRGPNAPKGKEVGAPEKFGHLVVQFSEKKYKVHRVIWIMHNGDIPEGVFIDHINRDPADNKIENLRLTTRSENNRNTVKRKGYTKRGDGYQVRVCTDNGRVTLGTFKTEEKARAVYINAKKSLGHIKEVA
jgi:hypothetical protein